MRELARELRNLGYERTERESPFEEGGQLWTNSFELVCDKTGYVIRKGASDASRLDSDSDNKDDDRVYRYRNTEKVKLYGGYVSSYDWGDDGDRFTY